MSTSGMKGAEDWHKPVVRAKDGRAVTTSDLLAHSFGISAGAIRQAIEQLMTRFPELAESHIYSLGELSADSDQRVFELDRDGFALLAVALVEVQQVDLKLQYLEAFEALEEDFDYAVDLIDPGQERSLRNWPLAELRAKKGVADLYRMVFGVPAAQWVMHELGFPHPPKNTVAVDHQETLPLDDLPPHATAA